MTATGASDTDLEKFFAEIENYKAEFAFNLISVFEKEQQAAKKEKRSPKKLSIPTYILQAFDFIKG